MTRGITLLCALGIMFSFSTCTKGSPPASPATVDSLPKDQVVHVEYDLASLPISDLYSLHRTQPLKVDYLKEISGLAISSSGEDNLLWAEEDSGNKSAIYLLDTLGRHLLTRYLPGIINLDWEDLAGGPGPEKGKYYIYVGDIGDNYKIRPFISVFRFPEPGLQPEGDSLIPSFDMINLIYPDGPHNAEALMVDPETGDIYIFTKDSVAQVFVAAYPQNTQKGIHLKLLETLPVSTITAADISRDGKKILLKNYDNIYYWERKPGESIVHCLERLPLRLRYKKEMQGEAVAWSYDGKSFFTLGEKVGSHPQFLYHYGLSE